MCKLVCLYVTSRAHKMQSRGNVVFRSKTERIDRNSSARVDLHQRNIFARLRRNFLATITNISLCLSKLSSSRAPDRFSLSASSLDPRKQTSRRDETYRFDARKTRSFVVTRVTNATASKLDSRERNSGPSRMTKMAK